MAFKPALLVIDVQNDFCSPQGSIAISNGVDLVASIKQLLSMPGFAMRVASISENPENHKVFAHNHKGATAWETHIDLPNSKEGMGHEAVKQVLFPKTCIKGTWGAKMPDGLSESVFDFVIRRNNHSDSWMYSVLKDVHGNEKHDLHPDAVSHHLGDELKSKGITHVFCVGTAGDYCVSHSAMDIADAGYKAYVIEDATLSVDNDKGWPAMKKKLKTKGVEVVIMNGPEVAKVRAPGGKDGNQAKMVFHGDFNGPVFFRGNGGVE